MPWALHSVIVHKNVPFETAQKYAMDIINDPTKTYYRIDSDSYRFRNYPKTYFDSKTFKSKVVNKNITLVFGELLSKWKHLKK